MKRKVTLVISAIVLLLVVTNIVFLFIGDAGGIVRHVVDKAGDAHKAITGQSKYEGPIYNRGEHAPAHDQGVDAIKAALDELAKIEPGVQPFDGNDYNFHVQKAKKLITDGELPMTSEVMKLFLQVSQENIATLKDSHKQVMNKLPLEVVPDAFGGRGIVMTGDKQYFPMILTAIRWVREKEADIPIEVFIQHESEYENNYCDGIFAELNVECVVIEKVYGKSLVERGLSAYALKPLAILASKFDDIYFMDADSFPVVKINDIFDSKLYEDFGYILSRDYWARFVSPYYYDIADIKLGGRASGDKECEVLLQKDRKNAIPGWSSESGQLFVSKSKHIRSLMLATYYNIYGPNLYFNLLMMSGPGEGDKDTYAAAAWVCKEPFYQTSTGPATLGFKENGEMNGVAMVQPDPREDYAKFVGGKKNKKPRMAQLHSANFKTNIKYFLNNPDDLRGFYPLSKKRYYGDLDSVQKKTGGTGDLELRLFDTMRYTACQWALKENAVPRDWEGEDVKKYCRILSAHVDYLKHNSGNGEDNKTWLELDNQGEIPEPEVSESKHTDAEHAKDVDSENAKDKEPEDAGNAKDAKDAKGAKDAEAEDKDSVTG